MLCGSRERSLGRESSLKTMKTKLILLLLVLPSMAWAQNVNAVIKNAQGTTVSPGDATNGMKVQVTTAVAPASVTSAPGATPSPSPAKAINIQGIPGMTAVTVHPDGTPFPVKIDQTTAGSTNATQPKQYTGVPSTFTIGTSDGTVFTLAAGEIGFIQNLDDAALAVKKGASASTTSLSFILAAGTAADDGKGGAVRIDDWVGVVSVAAMTGSPRFIAWKQAP